MMISPGSGTGSTQIFSYLRRLGSFLEVQNFEYQYFFQINEYFWGYEDFVDISGGHHKTVLFFFLGGGDFLHFRGFLRPMYRMEIFLG